MVNQKLSDMLLQLHISERTGRGVPKITNVYGKGTYEFRENSIVVSILFTKVNVTDDEVENTPDECMARRRNSAEYILDFCITPRSILEISEFLGYDIRRKNR